MITEFIGKEVIIRNNEDEPLERGVLVDYIKMGSIFLPAVEIDGKVFGCFSIVIPFEESMWNYLNQHPPKKQWQIMSDIVRMLRGHIRMEKYNEDQ